MDNTKRIRKIKDRNRDMNMTEEEKKICKYCGVEMKKFITTSANLYDAEMGNFPGGSTPFWTGDWYCPKCKRLNCWR